MARIFTILNLFLAVSCNSDTKESNSVYNNYQFDKQVVEMLPVYDSLVHVILENYPSLQSHIREDESYRAYRYLLYADSNDLFKKLPEQEAMKINHYFTRLGKNFIYGFDLFKDSSIKINIRSIFSENNQVEVKEYLSYYPFGSNVKHREYPIRDTILNKNWQYWTGFYKPDLF